MPCVRAVALALLAALTGCGDNARPLTSTPPDAPAWEEGGDASVADARAAIAVDGAILDAPSVMHDAVALDAERLDATLLDAAPLDSQPLDAAPLDAVPLDAEPLDAAVSVDAEALDAPSLDAESPDAHTTSCSLLAAFSFADPAHHPIEIDVTITPNGPLVAYTNKVDLPANQSRTEVWVTATTFDGTVITSPWRVAGDAAVVDAGDPHLAINGDRVMLVYAASGTSVLQPLALDGTAAGTAVTAYTSVGSTVVDAAGTGFRIIHRDSSIAIEVLDVDPDGQPSAAAIVDSSFTGVSSLGDAITAEDGTLTFVYSRLVHVGGCFLCPRSHIAQVDPTGAFTLLPDLPYPALTYGPSTFLTVDGDRTTLLWTSYYPSLPTVSHIFRIPDYQDLAALPGFGSLETSGPGTGVAVLNHDSTPQMSVAPFVDDGETFAVGSFCVYEDMIPPGGGSAFDAGSGRVLVVRQTEATLVQVE